MARKAQYLTQSTFYTPAFNSAIFDNNILIYYSQNNEKIALEIYFRMQNEYSEVRQCWQQNGNENKCIYVLLYPEQNLFQRAISLNKGPILNYSLSPEIVISTLDDDFLFCVDSDQNHVTSDVVLNELKRFMEKNESNGFIPQEEFQEMQLL